VDGAPTTVHTTAAVSKQPELRRAVEVLVADVTRAHAKSRYEHGVRPRCCFAIEPAGKKD
jgi:hypothetical protein